MPPPPPNQPKSDAKLDESLPYYLRGMIPRFSADELFKTLLQYDIISFDIFDTAILRRVEYPADIFKVLSVEMKYSYFWNARQEAEKIARNRKQNSEDHTREINIDDIYKVLRTKYGIASKWKDREIGLEITLCTPNPVILEIFNRLKSVGKTLIFMSDTHLPSKILHAILAKSGYTKYEKIFLSNEYKLSQRDGKLQPAILEEYSGKSIIHVGDDWNSDVIQTWNAGIPAIYYPAPRLAFREGAMESVAGSFYRGIINSRLACGNWNRDLYYTHGWRIGGILTAGFCQFVNNRAKSQNAEKILFCGRGCKIVSKIYQKFYNDVPSEHIQISKNAIFEVTTERNLYNLISNSVLLAIDEYRDMKPLREILQITGFDYLLEDLEEHDLEQFAFPKAVLDCKNRLSRFLIDCSEKIREHSQPHIDAARKYFADKVGDARKILIVDIGWAETCIIALKYFLETQIPDDNWQIHGALLTPSRNNSMILSMEDKTVDAYIYSPFHNLELGRFIYPMGKNANNDVDRLQKPLEFLFTSTDATIQSYSLDENGEIQFIRTAHAPKNSDQIEKMHAGIFDFVEEFLRNLKSTNLPEMTISPYVAFNPLMETIKNKEYIYEVYKDFPYSKSNASFETQTRNFGEVLGIVGNQDNIQDVAIEKRILFVSHEMFYAGSPRSLLRMCKVARDLGYYPFVWSAKPGAFSQEFEKEGIPVAIVTEKDLDNPQIEIQAKQFSLAICNTIMTDKYVRCLSKYIPVSWYVREATNIPDFVQRNQRRLDTLRDSRNIVCVSDYAADAIMKFTNHRPRVIHNCVEDESEMAVDYIPGQNKKIRFVQFGTIQRRKGYDVLVDAYLTMPDEYRYRSELYFAGEFCDSGTAFAAQLFRRIKGESNIHYLGVIRGEKNKIETLSSMDVVIVASRDESCSLVALEGAMLSKPLIVTENVGAKYMIDGGNGKIVKTEDVESLRNAMIYMIDHRDELESMGIQSRKNYESMASIDSYKKDLDANLFSRKISNVIVSLTSYPARINTVNQTIKSLLEQTVLPEKILLWLSEDNFPKKESELPQELLDLQENPKFEIRFVSGDLKPHKKYFYAMQEYPEHCIIVLDDDVIYDKTLVSRLISAYQKYPNCISAMRTNRILFKENGEVRNYQSWRLPDEILIEQPSYQLLPVGVGGVLYPPHSIPHEAFDELAIMEVCPMADDLWLKIWATHNNYPAVHPRDFVRFEYIPRTQEVGLSNQNVLESANDIAIQNILDYFDLTLGNGTSQKLLSKIREDGFL